MKLDFLSYAQKILVERMQQLLDEFKRSEERIVAATASVKLDFLSYAQKIVAYRMQQLLDEFEQSEE